MHAHIKETTVVTKNTHKDTHTHKSHACKHTYTTDAHTQRHMHFQT